MMNWSLAGSERVFRFRHEARLYAKSLNARFSQISRTINPVNSAMDYWGALYNVAPDGSRTEAEGEPNAKSKVRAAAL